MSNFTRSMRTLAKEAVEPGGSFRNGASVQDSVASSFLRELWSDVPAVVAEQRGRTLDSVILGNSQLSLAETINSKWGISRPRTLPELQLLEEEMLTAPLSSWKMKPDVYVMFTEIDNAIIQINPNKIQPVIRRPVKARSQPEITSYELTKISPFSTDFPVTVFRNEGGNDILLQERFGRSVADRAMWLNRRLFGLPEEYPAKAYDEGIPSLTFMLQANKQFRQGFEETLVWRQVLGVDDNHPFNIAMRLRNNRISFANIDMQSMFNASDQVAISAGKYYHGSLVNKDGALTLSPLTMEKLGRWHKMISTDGQVIQYLRQHINEDALKAMINRTVQMIDEKKLNWTK